MSIRGMKLTPFGKLLRKIRIDREELLGDMADKLGVTASYLSAIENGKRDVPSDWCKKLVNLYKLNSVEREQMEDSIYKSKKILKIDLEDVKDNQKELILTFARRIKNLDKEDVDNILEILDEKD